LSESADLESLRALARAFARAPFDLDIATEMISAMVRGHLSQRQLPVEQLHAMAAVIATTICDDPTARARLESLWRRLSEEVG
jgi:hypothetical protein